MERKELMVFSGVSLTLWAGNSLAATSVMNTNVRLFEDTVWLVAFLLMTVAGFLLRRLSGTGGAAGYWMLALAGLAGTAWKGIGVIKRMFSANDPKWFFEIARETFEGLSGIVLAVAFILLVVSIRRVYNRT